MSANTEPVWKPGPEQVEPARITDFTAWLSRERGVDVGGDLADCGLGWFPSLSRSGLRCGSTSTLASPGPVPVLTGEQMPGARWFPGARLNYVSQILRHSRAHRPALSRTANPAGRARASTARDELLRQVAAVAATLRGMGVQPGERVVGYLPNIAETVIAFLATASLGAIWSACGQDYAAAAAAARLGQLDPVVLIAADGYHYGGKTHDRRADIEALRDAVPTLRHTILVSRLGLDHSLPRDVVSWASASAGHHLLEPAAVPFDHPLWVLFSSGTTGLPKGIVHGHGGVLARTPQVAALHLDLGPWRPVLLVHLHQLDDVELCWFPACWSAPPSSATTAAPATPSGRAVAARRATPGHLLGTSRGVHPSAKGRRPPRGESDLSRLRAVGATGSPLPAAGFRWLHERVGDPSVLLDHRRHRRCAPLHRRRPDRAGWPGEISVPCLGVAVDA